jgi:hypothetical protein
MVKFEYTEIDYEHYPTIDDLNKLGQEGWQVWKMKKYSKTGELNPEDMYWTVYAMRQI